MKSSNSSQDIVGFLMKVVLMLLVILAGLIHIAEGVLSIIAQCGCL